MNTDRPNTIRLEDYEVPDYLVDSIDLDFDLEESATLVKSRMAIRANPEAPPNATGGSLPLRLDGEDLELVAIRLDGEALAEEDYRLSETGLTLPAPPRRFRLEIETRIDPKANTKLEGLYLSNGAFCTQCEAEGFRRITYFPDRPDVMSTYRVTLRADRERCPVLLSNGNLSETRELDGGRHLARWDDPFPKPSYLFALIAGDLVSVEDSFATASGREVALRIFVEHGNEKRCGYAMDRLKRAMAWDEERFGLEYDLDVFNIVAVGDFNMGAMENKSLNIFNSKYILADPESATDTDFAGIESVVAHEYFHNWTGNRVTCRDWFQLSLKEGLTVFRDQEFSADMRSRPVQRIADVRVLRARQFPEDAGPLAHPVRPDSYIEINNFYTATVYEKGAEVIRMLHRLLGPEGFRKGMDLYFERHDGQAVTCDDFVAALADANGRDLTHFKLWYGQAGTPEVKASGHYDAARQTYELTLRQSTPATPGQPDKRPLHIPLEVGLLAEDGAPLPVRLDGDTAEASEQTRVLELTEDAQTYRFLGVAEPPVVSLNRGFTAPVKIAVERNWRDRLMLMAGDPDPCARWEAGQQAAVKLLLDMVAEIAGGHEPAFDDSFIDAFGQVLSDSHLDDAFAGLFLTLPGESYLADHMETAAVDEIHAAREALARRIAAKLEPALRARYHGLRENRPFSPGADAAGRRALKATALGYLARLDDPAIRQTVTQQYHAADNMTDRMAALSALNGTDCSERQEMLDDLYGRFRDNPLVVDKWFAVQAISALPDTLERVEALLSHPAFTMRNPNKVRALIGAFSGNQVRFHRADGAGYRFLADRILELDSPNPQIAARLVAPLGQWRRFDANRQALIKRELERLVRHKGLSRDVYELASKSLA